MNRESHLALSPWLLEINVEALWMGGLKDHFPRDQPAHVGSHGSFVGSYPRLNQEFQVAGADDTVWTQPHQLTVEV